MNIRRVASLIVACTALSACDAPTAARPAFAYDPTILSGGMLYRWPNGSTIRVWAEPDPGSPYNLAAAVSSAIASWNDVPEFGEYELTMASSITDANVVVYDRAVTNPVSPGSCLFDARGSGYTYFCLASGTSGVAERLATRTGAATSVTVVVSVDRGRITSATGYEAVVAHELGHVLGIGGHSQNAGDLMFAGPTATVPSVRDRETLSYVLGQQPSGWLR